MVVQIFFLFLASNVFANYIDKRDILSCESSKRRVYSTIEECSKYGVCTRLPEGFFCETWKQDGNNYVVDPVKQSAYEKEKLDKRQLDRNNFQDALTRLKNSTNQDAKDFLLIFDALINQLEKRNADVF